MVAVIKVSASLGHILNYNENKVAEQKAVCLYAGNYPVDSDKLNFTMKQNYLQRRLELNTNVSRNTLHISLNFDPSENGLGNERMTDIARAYMKELGFGEQPYLMYRHFDAGHPHLHIVTTNIRQDGSRIGLHHLALRKSEPARKKLELDFGLVRAQGHTSKANTKQVRVAGYGKSETRTAIQNVLGAVLDKYHYTSLSELNAVLGLYNVWADRGADGSRVARHGGLLYRIISANGESLGIPIKASLFHNRPTLKRLEVKFAKNRITGSRYKTRIKNAIDGLSLPENNRNLSNAITKLASQGISVVKRQNGEGSIFGLTYVDHQSGAVFNGSAIGKAYSAKAMLLRFPDRTYDGDTKSRASEKLERLSVDIAGYDPRTAALLTQITALLNALANPEFNAEYVPKHFSRKKKKRKKGQQGNG